MLKLNTFFLILHALITQVYCNDGNLNTTFGSNANGTTITPPSNFSATSAALINSIALQSDNKIVAGGQANVGGTANAALARYTSNGLLDTTFGTFGTTSISFGAGSSSVVSSVAIQSDGKIVAGGAANLGSGQGFALARLNTDGSLDTSFGTNGLVTQQIGTTSSISSILIQFNGEIVAAGGATISGTHQFALARFNTNGSLDTSFGTNGIQTQIIGTTSNIMSIALQSNGEIIAGGTANVSGILQAVLARFTTNGLLDTSFGTNGIATIPSSGNSSITTINTQSNDQIIVVGSITSGSNVARLNSNGSLDTTFATNGIFSFPNSPTLSGITSLTIQSNNKIILGGTGTDSGGKTSFGIARLTTNGTLDNSFGTNGVTIIPIGLFGPNGTTAQINSIKVQSDPQILAGGLFINTSFENFALASFSLSSGCIASIAQAISDKYGI